MSGWVDVSERLPEPHRKVIVAYGRNLSRLVVCEGRMYYAGEWGFEAAWNQDYDPVRYWMPLPEPPTRGERRKRAAA